MGLRDVHVQGSFLALLKSCEQPFPVPSMKPYNVGLNVPGATGGA